VALVLVFGIAFGVGLDEDFIVDFAVGLDEDFAAAFVDGLDEDFAAAFAVGFDEVFAMVFGADFTVDFAVGLDEDFAAALVVGFDVVFAAAFVVGLDEDFAAALVDGVDEDFAMVFGADFDVAFLFAFLMAPTSSCLVILDRPVTPSFLATFCRCSLLALASTPWAVLPERSVAPLSDGPFACFDSQWSPIFSNECLSAANAVMCARRPSPYSLTAESCALIHVFCAFFGERMMVDGSSLTAGMSIHLLQRWFVVMASLLVHRGPASLGLLVDLVAMHRFVDGADCPACDGDPVDAEQEPGQATEHEDDTDYVDVEAGEVELDGPGEDRTEHDEDDASGDGHQIYLLDTKELLSTCRKTNQSW
jgi:hypothetical protein